MKARSNLSTVKGIAFAGCSFTWGQGLYYYGNSTTIIEPPPDCYHDFLVTDAHKEYMKTVRFPRLVAQHFKTYELVMTPNGGACDGDCHWWDCVFKKIGKSMHGDITPKVDYEDIEHFVFQFTQWHRNSFNMRWNEKDDQIAYWQTNVLPHSEYFHDWLKANNLTYNQWEHNAKQSTIDGVRTFLQELELKGVKVSVFTWPHDIYEYIKADEWLSSRFFELEYQGKSYSGMEKMMQENPELVINSDYENFEITPKDHHPSLKCHRVMSENLIRHLEKK